MSDGDGREREDLRPRIGGRAGEVPQERVPRFRNRLLARVARIGGGSGTTSSRPRGTAWARDVPRPGSSARRCVIKARFVPMNAYGKRAAVLYLSYVGRNDVDQDGGAGSVYGPVVPTGRALGRVEAKALGVRLAADRGYTFRDTPAGLAGTLTMGPMLSSGRH